jgi:hypothetical protein
MIWAKKEETARRIVEIETEMRLLPRAVPLTESYCHCKYGSGALGCFADCECPKQMQNPRLLHLEAELKKLIALRFCSCGSQVLPEFTYCPFCAARLLRSGV